MCAAILLPARVVLLGAEGMLLAPTDRIDSRGRNAQRNQVVLGGLRTALAKPQVVFRRTAVVAMSFESHASVRIGAQEFGVLGERFAGIVADIGLVEVEERVLNVLIE